MLLGIPQYFKLGIAYGRCWNYNVFYDSFIGTMANPYMAEYLLSRRDSKLGLNQEARFQILVSAKDIFSSKNLPFK